MLNNTDQSYIVPYVVLLHSDFVVGFIKVDSIELGDEAKHIIPFLQLVELHQTMAVRVASVEQFVDFVLCKPDGTPITPSNSCVIFDRLNSKLLDKPSINGRSPVISVEEGGLWPGVGWCHSRN